ncbi:MAG: nucleotidyltransferase family protein [Cyclobacteriaceae bacterium]|nr:nucleotidyltransferase family protein [Cyclobacteriaceae bacterium]
MSVGNEPNKKQSGDGIAVLILAAGSSSRLGQSKQLLEVSEVPLLRKTVLTALDADTSRVFVVLGHNATQHQQIIQDLNIDIMHHPGWHEGMGSSLKAGVSHILENQAHTQAILVLVCDQPFITTEHLNTLVSSYKASGAPIVASAYASTTGVPALFDKNKFAELLELENAQGAKKILEKNIQGVLSVEFPEGAIDIDTPADYKNLTR